MKKSKIIVPAVALLALGMAASVTSTVAWFSSNSSVTASSLTAAVHGSDSLTISDDISSYTWKYGLEWSASKTQMSPVTPVSILKTETEAPLTKTTAHYTSVNSSDQYQKSTETNQIQAAQSNGEGAVDYLKFIKPVAANVSDGTGEGNPVAGKAINAVATSESGSDNSANYVAADDSNDFVHEDFALRYTGNATATVNGTITIQAASAKDVDHSLRVGLLDVNNKKFTVYGFAYNATATGSPLAYPSISVDAITISASDADHDNAMKFHVYVWYEGEDLFCRDQYAITNNLTVGLSFGLAA